MLVVARLPSYGSQHEGRCLVRNGVVDRYWPGRHSHWHTACPFIAAWPVNLMMLTLFTCLLRTVNGNGLYIRCDNGVMSSFCFASSNLARFGTAPQLRLSNRPTSMLPPSTCDIKLASDADIPPRVVRQTTNWNLLINDGRTATSSSHYFPLIEM